MRSIICLSLISGLLILLTLSAEAQVNEWPYDLKPPEPAQTPATDTSGTDFISQQSLYMNTIVSLDSLRISSDNRVQSSRQIGYYRLEKNELFNTRKQYFDLSGAVLKKKFIGQHVSMGLDWTPIVLLNSSSVNHALSGSLDIGPVIQADILSIPLTIRGGLAGKVQNDNFSIDELHETISGNARRDKGLYAAYDAGTGDAPVYSWPLFINLKGYGRSQETSKLFTNIGSALLCRDFISGDTLSLLYTDSLINGSGAVLGDEGAQGKSFFMDIPQSIIRSYGIKGGIQAKYRFFLQPAFYYSFARHSLQYPGDDYVANRHNELSDRQNTVSSVNAMLKSDPSLLISYSGGLRIDLEKEEKLFKGRISSYRMIDSSNADSLKVKLNDYDGYRAIMKHVVSMRTKQGAGLEYTYNISRYLKTYPFHYLKKKFIPIKIDSNAIDIIMKTDTLSSDDDKDWIIQNHHLALIPISNPRGKISFIGEYSKNLSYYLKEEKSANNSMDYFYLLGVNSFFNVSERVKFEESIATDVKRTEYVFPHEYHALGFLPPSYSRELSALSQVTWKPDKKYMFAFQWKEHYEDDGYWFDKESVDSTGPHYDSLIAIFNPYYGIERIQWRHSCALNATIMLNQNTKFSLGGSFEYVFQKKFNDLKNEYVIDELQTRYIFVPSLAINSQLNQYFTFKTKIMRNVDTVKDDYWDFIFNFNARF
jgi:hypothetical protein